jgi:nitroreductase/Pyruvate/2-oxoacid:ferredoxin oxidoreductase delta subunit
MAFEKFSKTYLPASPEVWSNSIIVVDEEKCDGCGNCIQACPCACLEVVEKKARMIQGIVCMSCSACVAHCQKDAISMQGFYNVEEGLFKTMLLHPEDGHPVIPEIEGIEGLTPVEEVIYKRRSNRIFSKRPVADEMVRRVIEAGRFAPSHGNNEPWSFIIINDREEMDKIAEMMDPLYRFLARFYFSGKTNPITRKLLAFSSFFVPPMLDQRAITGGAAIVKPKDVFLGAPCLVYLLGDKRGINNMYVDIGICGQNMILAAHSLGLVTCWMSFAGVGAKVLPWVKRYLGIKWPYVPVTAMVMGYPRVNADSMVKRELPRITWRKGGKTWTEMP